MTIRRSFEPRPLNTQPIETRPLSGTSLMTRGAHGLYGSTQVSFFRTTTTVTAGGQLGVGSRRPCSKIPSGATVVTSDPKLAQSG
ncbi:hypothetical protein CRG98_028565 [Punica granatum]|uniref:Uncharacterized protein n=1 Tax=Punica granatum TaxID=22663 RepID=A0A2I0J555_PUNGR|nr:hypothetical protein CRG98_028565 [Punica granatum]